MCHDRRHHGPAQEARGRLQRHEEEEAWEETHSRGRGARSWRAREREKKPLSEKFRGVASGIR